MDIRWAIMPAVWVSARARRQPRARNWAATAPSSVSSSTPITKPGSATCTFAAMASIRVSASAFVSARAAIRILTDSGEASSPTVGFAESRIRGPMAVSMADSPTPQTFNTR